MPAIGILGGMGPQASAHLQTLLVKDAPRFMNIKNDSDFPEIVTLSVPVPNFVNNSENMQKAKIILKQKTQLLEQAGCVVNGIACNTAHLLLPDLQAVTKVPFLSIPALISDELTKRGAKRVGILATPATLKSRLYDDAIHPPITLVKPEKAIVDELEQLILRRLASSETTPEDSVRLHEIVNQFIDSEELDVVILGCTELPLLFGDDTHQKVVSSLNILSEGLLKAWLKKIKNAKQIKLLFA